MRRCERANGNVQTLWADIGRPDISRRTARHLIRNILRRGFLTLPSPPVPPLLQFVVRGAGNVTSGDCIAMGGSVGARDVASSRALQAHTRGVMGQEARLPSRPVGRINRSVRATDVMAVVVMAVVQLGSSEAAAQVQVVVVACGDLG